ncbi:hypothetical protein EDC96DRAFT_527596 [Choanephora cucurbitarum]|nr:hypothetical protein EDC96DRAFT_527596 [Choanephora cucurbitarum]
MCNEHSVQTFSCLHVSALNLPSSLSLPAIQYILSYRLLFALLSLFFRAFITKLCTPNRRHLAILLCIHLIAILTHIIQNMHSLCIYIPAY